MEPRYPDSDRWLDFNFHDLSHCWLNSSFTLHWSSEGPSCAISVIDRVTSKLDHSGLSQESIPSNSAQNRSPSYDSHRWWGRGSWSHLSMSSCCCSEGAGRPNCAAKSHGLSVLSCLDSCYAQSNNYSKWSQLFVCSNWSCFRRCYRYS